MYVKFSVHKFLRDLRSFSIVFKIIVLKVRNLCCTIIFIMKVLLILAKSSPKTEIKNLQVKRASILSPFCEYTLKAPSIKAPS